MPTTPEPWVIPPYVQMRTGQPTSESEKLSWVAYSTNLGLSYNESQRAWKDVELGQNIVNGDFFTTPTGELSNVSTNRTKRQIREIVESLGNMRVVSRYKTFNRDLVKRVQILDRLFMGWWEETGADFWWKDCLKWACACGTGYMVPRWDKDFYGPGMGDIVLDIFGPKDVVVIQPPRNHDMQKAYAVGFRRETPLDLVRRTWPERAQEIVADRDMPSGFKKAVPAVARYASAVLNRYGFGAFDQDESKPFPMVDVWTWYVRDGSINTSGKPVQVGPPGASWSYIVPSLGDRIPMTTYDAQGVAVQSFREATHQDCLMFPNRRVLVATKTCILEDGPNPDHHGMVPAIQMRVDDWPWNWLGYGMCREGADLEQSNISLMRDIVDASHARLNPPFGYDSDRMTEDAAAQINPRLAGQTIAFQLGGLANLDQVFKPLVQPVQYDVPSIIPAFIKEQEARMDYQMGVTDVSAMVKSKQLPASDGLEKLLQAQGPLAEGMARNQERCMNELGPFIKSLQFQYYSAGQIVQMIGYDKAIEIKELWDGEPGDMIPSHMPGENTREISPTPRWKRAKWAADQYSFQLTPYSLHKLAQSSRRLSLLVLQKQGFPIDPWTIAEAYELPDFGVPPASATTILERWIEYQELSADIQVMLQRKLAAAGVGAPQGGHKGQGRGGGRPNSFAQEPTQQSKESGARSTIRTSER